MRATAESAAVPGPIDSILDAVGGTPVVRLNRVVEPGMAAVWAKAEFLNPGGSVKDRIGLSMLDAAERDGELKPGGTVVEPTSGNTGIGLALVCAARGYELVLTMPESMSLERRQALENLGAKIVLTPAEDVMHGAVREAARIAKETGAFMPQQFENPANPAAHREHTARELLAFCDAEQLALDGFVAGVGTGGTVTGTGPVLKARFPALRVVAVEPASSAVLSGKPAGPTKIQGLGAGFVPGIVDRAAFDRVVAVTDRDAWDMKVRLAREEGMLTGISSGASVWAALQLARELGPGKHVLTVLADTGERYFSLAEYFK